MSDSNINICIIFWVSLFIQGSNSSWKSNKVYIWTSIVKLFFFFFGGGQVAWSNLTKASRFYLVYYISHSSGALTVYKPSLSRSKWVLDYSEFGCTSCPTSRYELESSSLTISYLRNMPNRILPCFDMLKEKVITSSESKKLKTIILWSTSE